MPILTELHSDDNLRRAWRWLRSNTDATFKRYFRDLYGIYAIADIQLLKRIQDRLKRGIYEPTRSCKLFFPKSSGILRPYSLLTIEDQIVYQAAVNLVAERLMPRVKHRYNNEVFGHLYAGKTSTWFYRKWSDGYNAFNDAARKAFNDGFRVTASFDLTACYDSLDHGVLRHQLAAIGCDKEFCQKLTAWLSVWTATDQQIYHHHGIPQGPLSSGLLSEVVLRYFDDDHRRQRQVVYLRYVDDIRLFAKSERELRRMLVRLDMLSKDIGLFPQTSKIGIHELKDIETELKGLSHPTESAIRLKTVNQEKLKKRLVKLTPNFRVSNSTRFKYLLAHAQPDAKLTDRLWRIFENHPEYYAQLGRYIARYQRVPRKTAERLIREIERQELYPSVREALISSVHGRLHLRDQRKLASLVKTKIWKPRDMPADLYASAGRLLIESNRLTQAQLTYAFRSDRSWWARAQLILALNQQNTAGGLLAALLNSGLKDQHVEVALGAAFSIVMHGVPVGRPLRQINFSGAEILRQFGTIVRTPPMPCGIETSLQRMLGPIPHIDWKKVFKSNYRDVEKHIVYTRALSETNVSAWVNAIDVFDDWMVNALFAHDPSIGQYQLGSIGSILNGGRFQKKYPAIYALVADIHEKRLENALSHPKTKRTGKPTQPIRFGYLKIGLGLLRKALVEIAAKW